MAKVHYFQRYSSYENAATNNLLQLFARIYGYSAAKASQLLTDITGTDVEIGMEVTQQTRGVGSIPDGALIQRSFRVLLEAKVDAGVDANQLVRHTDSFAGESLQILLLVTRQGIRADSERDIQRRISESEPGVIFRSTTYETICQTIDDLFLPHEAEMVALCEDFVEYCNDTGLSDQSRYFMRIVPCGKSININRKYGVYFQPSDRGYTEHSYVGIYKNKSVRCLWKIDSVFDVTLQDGRLAKTLVHGRDTNDHDDRIKAIIADALPECGYQIASGHRFFCGTPIDTDYRKESNGGMQGTRLENLRQVLGREPGSVEEIASSLRQRTWK